MAREVYVDVLGLTETPKPENLPKRGGLWVEGITLRLHLGFGTEFRAARKAPPALFIRHLEAMAQHLQSAGGSVVTDEPLDEIRPHLRCRPLRQPHRTAWADLFASVN